MKSLLAILVLSIGAGATDCKVTFSVVTKDDLNNIRQGFAPKTLEWYQKKMTKKYPDVCYSAGASSVVLFFSARPTTYHGTKTLSSTTTKDNPISGEIRDSDPTSSTYGQKVGEIDGSVQTSTTTESTVPYDVDFQVLYLSIETKLPDGSWRVAHNFSGKTLQPTMYGFCTHNCHPNYVNIENALKWLHDGGLSDPLQTVLP